MSGHEREPVVVVVSVVAVGRTRPVTGTPATGRPSQDDMWLPLQRLGGVVRLAIADPPYPPFIGSGGRKNRASRWYGTGQCSSTDRPSDIHPEADHWDDPARHRALLLELLDGYDGFAISTSPDGLAAYGPLPAAARIMAWVKPNACPGAHRLRSLWEPVILYPPVGRRSNRNGAGIVPDVLTAALTPEGFKGAKPAAYTNWLLDALGFDPDTDDVMDVFPGSGAVSRVIAQRRNTLPGIGAA